MMIHASKLILLAAVALLLLNLIHSVTSSDEGGTRQRHRTTTTTTTATTTSTNEAHNVFERETPIQSARVALLHGAPYVNPKTANERVIIPDPPAPARIDDASFNCPHQDADLLDWHSIDTWGNNAASLPQPGNNVTLPFNSRVIIRQSVEGVLGIVTIPSSSELIFDDVVDTVIEFHVHGMDVQGNLTIGSETCRMSQSSQITITLHGDRPHDVVQHVPPPTTKGISVEGTINVHGRRFHRTWTRLAVTVEPGDTYVMLQHAVNWLPGHEIVLVTTAMKDSREWHRNEIAIVDRVQLNPVQGIAAAVFLKHPVSYQHLASDGYQGEVGLLTRNVKIQGSYSDSEPTDPDPLNCEFTNNGLNNYGDRGRPCPNTELTGYGGHIMIHNGGKGKLEGVELYRMGQTNVLGRYPMHFHLLGDQSDCYFRDSSVHRSFYRCISIHGTHYTQVSENVAYDVTGFCYYLEDGVEHDNRIEFNLGAHIHPLLGPDDNAPVRGEGQKTNLYQQSHSLTMPGDVTASAFYITNVHNYVIGNVASGGWSGFAFPNLPAPLGPHRHDKVDPSSVTALTIDGNTAHSTAWWWENAAAFYFGGSIYYNDDGILEYNAGRDLGNRRSTCLVNKCEGSGCGSYCRPWEQGWLQISNTKVFLTAGIGFGSWSGRLEVLGYECHDCGLSMMALSDGFWATNMLSVCRTNHPIALPEKASASRIRADGFRWYDTGQEHIITNTTFRNCGYRSDEYNQYEKSRNRGCGDNDDSVGCLATSSVWAFLTHSDQHVPEMMQATRSIEFENCGRRFRHRDFRSDDRPSSVSGREQNWLDADGSITGFRESSIVASGLADAGMWWQVDDEVIYDEQGPLWFFKLTSGPQRGLGHFKMKWDESLNSQVGVTQCGNGANIPCDYVGYIKHLGDYFESDLGLPVTASADIVGPVGGFGWKLELNGGAPKSLRFEEVEVDPDTPLLLSIAYPPGTSFAISYHAGWCNSDTEDYSCSADFVPVDSIASVRNSKGNAYHVDSAGVLTIRIVQTPKTFVGNPEFFLPTYSDKGRNGVGYALERFERDGIRLPVFVYGAHMTLDADCPSTDDGVYCSKVPPTYEPNVCPDGYIQTGYDTCTLASNETNAKLFADGSNKVVETTKPIESNEQDDDLHDDDLHDDDLHYDDLHDDSGGALRSFSSLLVTTLVVGATIF